MLMDYVVRNKGKEFYIEANCEKETFKQMIEDYKKAVHKTTVRGLWHYLRQKGYRVDEMTSGDKESAEAILNL